MSWFNPFRRPREGGGPVPLFIKRPLVQTAQTLFYNLRYWAPAFAGATLLFLTSCGFQPLYGGGQASVTAHYADIAIPNIPDRDGQYLRNVLIDRLYTQGRPTDARYDLKIDPLRVTLTDLGIQKDATVTRTQVEILAHVQLIDKITGKPLLDRQVRAVGGYDVLDQQYTTVITRQNVTEHVLDDLAANIVTEMDLYFRREIK
jgi:LPS-assembly lipoprotein